MNPYDCPECGMSVILRSSDYPAEMLARPVQHWRCEHCGAPVIRTMTPGASVADRAWKSEYGRAA